MPTPTLITDLSITAAANSPAGSDSPATLDDVQRAHASFIAQLAAGTNFTAPVLVTNGGTGRVTGTTAFALKATGTTATGIEQSLGVGGTTDLLVGGGGAALPVWTAATGTGAPVRATSPTLVTPVLGTPASGTLTNATGLPPTGVVGTAAILGANTFTAAQNFATGAAIASSATINLDTATGNRVHITGTTAITAVTLTNGPRTVVFDGVLTLTHSATTNNLPSASNITTAVGDRAVYESDGTTVYCIAYTRANGAPVTSAGDHAAIVNSGNGHGSTNTKIRRFTTTLTSVGTAITYADSITLGASFTINETGIYEVFTQESTTSAFGISVNSSQLTTNIQSILVVNRLGINSLNFNSISGVSRVVRLLAGDVIRAHTDGGPTNTTDMTYFSVRKVVN